MNRKLVFNYLGKIMIANGSLMLLPIVCALIYKEYNCLNAFLTTAVFCAAIGAIVSKVCKPKNDLLYAKEGFAIVATAWLLMSLTGAVPFVLSGEIPNYADAFFETVSGYTTTGASILDNVESLQKTSLLWRSFTHWIGGMGVLVFVMAILPGLSDRSVHIMRAEMPGPIFGKLVPRFRDTAKILYLIYIVMTAIMIPFLLFGGMSFFESLLHAFGTAGTGGFGIKADSIGGYSPYIQWVITVFMILFGVNFNLYYYFIIKRSFAAFKNTELFAYLGIIAASVAAICINIYNIYGSFSESIRAAAFQVSAIITTTGFSTANFDLWPDFSKTILFLLMFVGGCAGSTAGGLKVSRILLMFKIISSEIKHLLHPRAVTTVRLDGKTVDNATLHSVTTYFSVYAVCYAAVLLIISFEPFGFTTNITAVTTCINNVGPGFDKIGPAASFSLYNNFSTVVLAIAMLLGRLEIFPLLLTLLPQTWSEN